jgi:hypothetical protein
MSIAALLTTAKLWNQPKCLSIDEWMKQKWYMYTMEYYSAVKKNETITHRKMDRTRDYHVKPNNSDSER